MDKKKKNEKKMNKKKRGEEEENMPRKRRTGLLKIKILLFPDFSLVSKQNFVVSSDPNYI